MKTYSTLSAALKTLLGVNSVPDLCVYVCLSLFTEQNNIQYITRTLMERKNSHRYEHFKESNLILLKITDRN